LSDRELLDIELALLCDLDDRRRIRAAAEFAVGIAGEDVIALVGHNVPDDIAAALLACVDKVSRPNEPPRFMRDCAALLTGEFTLTGGPSYYVERPITSDIEIFRSDDPDAQRLHDKRPDNWESGEWRDLINGGAGAPWAMVLKKDRVVSICHTPGRSAIAAEAGTWTDPEFRRRGYAAATTAVWAELLAKDCPYLFYSTSADNHSSQHVAERLGLRPIGWTWKLTRGN
jgi:RimJ/RimL family protein N-acetyltransferase